MMGELGTTLIPRAVEIVFSHHTHYYMYFAHEGTSMTHHLQLLQQLTPTDLEQRFEGIAFSACGNILGAVTSDSNAIHLYQRTSTGLFDSTPFQIIKNGDIGLDYPHDLSFSFTALDTSFFAVAQRSGSIFLFAKDRTNGNYQPTPVFKIHGRRAKLKFTDAVAFMPPNNDLLAAANLTANTIAFYQKQANSPFHYAKSACYVLKHPDINRPDGVAFSDCGHWLAVTNHGNNSVSIFQKSEKYSFFKKRKLCFILVCTLKDPSLCCPHSVAFTPENNLIVTNAGANYFSLYLAKKINESEMTWLQTPIAKYTHGEEKDFMEINACNKQEGGPKGVAIYKDTIAVASPQYGIKLYAYQES